MQEDQYQIPYHWNQDKRVESSRYLNLTRLIASTIRQNASSKSVFSICDFGCGDGRGSYLLWRLLRESGVAPTVFGLDISNQAIQWARDKTQAENDGSLHFSNESIDAVMQQFPQDAGMNVFVMREVIEHLLDEEIDETLSKAKNAMQRGMVILTTPSINSPVEAKHIKHYTADEMRSVFSRNGIEPIDVFGYGFRPGRLYGLLNRVKSILNSKPVLWRLMNPAWRRLSPRWAITIVGVGRFGD